MLKLCGIEGTCNVRSLYRSGSRTTVVRELARYKLDVVDVQEIRWDKGGTTRSGDYTLFCGKRNENHQLGTEYFSTSENFTSS